ncbi:MAG: hypothetical protein ACI90V_001989 [Bacillariaceae sp.]|jgi:hypothetical protein
MIRIRILSPVSHLFSSFTLLFLTLACSFCVISMYDTFYKFYSNDILFCFWSSRSTIRTCLLWNWFRCYLLWSDRIGNSYAKISEKFVHCLFNWWYSTVERDLDDCTVLVKYRRGGTPQLGRNLWKGIVRRQTRRRTFICIIATLGKQEGFYIRN